MEEKERQILQAIDDAGEPLTIPEIMKRTGLAFSAVTMRLGSMIEQERYIEMAEYLFRITDAGREELAFVNEHIEENKETELS